MSDKKNTIDAPKISTSKIWKLTLVISVIIGIFGSLADILGFIDIFKKNQPLEKHQLTVFVTDTQGNVVLEHEGILNTSIGNRSLRETIGEDGRINFGDILPEYLGNSITIGLIANGWKIANNKNTFIFTGDPIQIKINKDNSLGIIKGAIRNRNGQKFISNALIKVNNDTTTFSNPLGIFKITLPESMRVKNANQQYNLTIIKEGYKTKDIYYIPKSNADIRLEKI